MQGCKYTVMTRLGVLRLIIFRLTQMWRFPIMISNNEKYFFSVILRFEWKLANELIDARLHWGTFGINSSRRSCLQPCASLHCCRQRSPVWPGQEQRRPQLRTPGEETVVGGTETGDRAVTRAKEWIKTLYCIHIKSSWSSWNRHTVCCNTLLDRCKIEHTFRCPSQIRGFN